MQVTKLKAPQYTIAGRVEPPGDKTLKPGPGAHSPEKVWEKLGPEGWAGLPPARLTVPGPVPLLAGSACPHTSDS